MLRDFEVELSVGPGGLCQLLNEAYNRKMDITVRGFSGYNSRWMLPMLEQILAKRTARAHLPTVRLLALWLGPNDAAHPGEPQHVPRAEFAANLRAAVRMVRDPASAWHAPGTRVLLLTPPPVHVAQWVGFLSVAGQPAPRETTDRDFDGMKAYAEAVREVGMREGVPVVDVWSVLWEAAGRREEGLADIFLDGLHMKPVGYKLVYDAFIATILEHYPEIHYDNLPMAYPYWCDIIGKDHMQLLQHSSATTL
ncbi:SGNH hydrolase [Phanerochaete sordida]|uniref:SGNH hydrolase n=1 Tax=Phanerochaete sordida TaxID=48140 RepID=A0A9P3LKA3_9APHY|nr:SGNH hydrolase [Phanerochaete sordida]